MPDFRPETPLGQAVQELLRKNSEGLTTTEIRHKLSREKGLRVSEDNLGELLKHGHIFAVSSGGRFVLAGAEPARIERSKIERTATPSSDPLSQPLIVNLPAARRSYIVFDLETTGTNSADSLIIQVAALKVLDGHPVAVRSWYANPGERGIPHSVQLLLGIDRDPALHEAIAGAPDQAEVIERFWEFVGDLPLVAFNARFDARFLAAATGGMLLTNTVVDALELALLMLPDLANHQLSQVATALDLAPDSLTDEWNALQLDSNLPLHNVSAATLHNAITDVYILHRAYERLLQRLDSTGPVRDLLCALLPEAYDANTSFGGIDNELLDRLRRRGNGASALRQLAVGGDAQTAGSNDPSTVGSDLLAEYLHSKSRQLRPGQVEMRDRVAAAMLDGHFAMIEAPTGTGKTLAYLTAAIEQARTSGMPVALSTAYRNLQDQLRSEIDNLQQSGLRPFKSQLLKGVGNYICWSQIEHYLGAGDRSRQGSNPPGLDERFVLAYTILALAAGWITTADEMSYWLLETLPVARGVIAQLRASASCNPQLQPSCAHCPMPAAYAAARTADIVVINHALWLSDPERLPPFNCLVLDEAHTLEDVATEALAQEVSSATLSLVLDRLFNPRMDRGLLTMIRASTHDAVTLAAAAGAIAEVRRIRPLLDVFGGYIVQFIRRCTGRVDPRYGASFRLEAPPWKVHASRWAEVENAYRQLFALNCRALLDALVRLFAACTAAADLAHRNATLRDLSALIDDLAGQRKLVDELLTVADLKRVYWLEVGPPRQVGAAEEAQEGVPTSWAIKSAPIDVGQALAPFYDRLNSAVFTSATLALRGNDFSYYIDRLGLGERLESNWISKLAPALPYDERVFLGLADYLTYAPLQTTMDSFKEELAGELDLFLRFSDGRALGLFTARERMEAVANRVAPELARHSLPLYWQTPDASKKRLLDTFKERKELSLFGLRSFWEGVDVPGETLSFVLMEKLPFPLLIEPVHRARAAELQRQGRSEFDDYMLPLMLLQFKQGFGRLMRDEKDRGAVILFDKRIHRKDYKADLLRSLPGYIPRDAENERGRRRFYEAIARALPGLIDLEAKSDLLAGLPENILLDFENILRRLQLPQIVSDAEYAQWRPTLLAALQELFKHDGFRTVDGMDAQEQVIRHILAGRDVLGILPTGAGKSLTFQLTALLRDGLTLVFSPLIALMKDQVAGLAERGIEVVGAIYSGQSSSERDDVLERIRRGRARLVYISPERLRDPVLLATLKTARVIQMVVDEAHCVYMWGASFRPDFLALPQLFDVLGYRPPVAALTATATPAMREAICAALQLHDPAYVIAPVDRPELQFAVYNTASRYGRIASRNDRFRALLRILQAADQERPPMLIYVSTTVEADQLARQLRVAGYDARAYHGKMEPTERNSVQEMFMDDHVNIVVCTKAFGMGIDKPDIRYVIHYNMPGDLESYFQEAGRAGRDGKTAYCVLLYHSGDIGTQEFFIDHSTPDEETINGVLEYLAGLRSQTLYLDPEQVQEQLGLEDVQLRVALHHLETQGYIKRLFDFTLTGSLTLQVAPEEMVAALESLADPDSELLARLLEAAKWPAYRKLEIEWLPLADALGATPTHIDTLMLRLARRDMVVYRPWRRGFVLQKAATLEPGQRVEAGALAAERHKAEMHHKLDEMRRYAESNNTCRRASLLRYFGQQTPSRCAGCDVCKPADCWPWSLVGDRDTATPDAFVDPPFIILETVHWNQHHRRKHGAPYGTGTMLAVLKGDSFSAARFESDPQLKKWRLAQLRACPNWGALSMLPARDRQLAELLERLLAGEYIERSRYYRADNESYEFLALSVKGLDQLTSGRLFRW